MQSPRTLGLLGFVLGSLKKHKSLRVTQTQSVRRCAKPSKQIPFTSLGTFCLQRVFLLLSFFIRRASVCWKEVAWHLVGVRLPSFWKIQLASASLCQAVLKPFAWCSECNASVTGFIHGGFRGFTVSNHRQEHTISIHFIRVGHSRQCRIGCDNF